MSKERTYRNTEDYGGRIVVKVVLGEGQATQYSLKHWIKQFVDIKDIEFNTGYIKKATVVYDEELKNE